MVIRIRTKLGIVYLKSTILILKPNSYKKQYRFHKLYVIPF